MHSPPPSLLGEAVCPQSRKHGHDGCSHKCRVLVSRRRLAILALHPSRYGDATARSGLYRSGEDAGQPLHDLSIQTNSPARMQPCIHSLPPSLLGEAVCPQSRKHGHDGCSHKCRVLVSRRRFHASSLPILHAMEMRLQETDCIVVERTQGSLCTIFRFRQTPRKDVALHALPTSRLAGRGCLPAVEEAWS